MIRRTLSRHPRLPGKPAPREQSPFRSFHETFFLPASYLYPSAGTFRGSPPAREALVHV